MADSFSNKVCVVTGAGSGIGRELVLGLLAEGAVVHALDRDGERLAGLAGTGDYGDRLATLVADVTDRASVAAAADQIHGQSGRVDLLVNNAGVTLLGETKDISFAQWKEVLDVNYLGTLHGIHSFYPHMVKRGGGHIANVASIAGSSGYATAQAYATSKAAVIGFSRSLEVEAKTHGVTVTNVCPSYVETGIFKDSLKDGWNGERIRATFMTAPVSAEVAAQKVLAGLRKRKKTIVFPFTGRVLYWMSRWMPCGLGMVQRIMLKKYRAARPPVSQP